MRIIACTCSTVRLAVTILLCLAMHRAMTASRLGSAWMSPLTGRYHKRDDAKRGTKTAQPAYFSGGGWNGGCEDPRLTLIDNRVYLTYTAFDGWGSIRIALSSIGLEDFLNKNWKWKKPALISPPGQIHKNWVIFPEKIHGKFAILHGITPNVLIEYVDSLDFDGSNFINSSRPSNEHVLLRKGVWDSRVRGVGPAPIKTEAGWLLLYHAIDERDPDGTSSAR